MVATASYITETESTEIPPLWGPLYAIDRPGKIDVYIK